MANFLMNLLLLVRSLHGCSCCIPAMSSLRAACGPVEGFVRPSLSFRCSISRGESKPERPGTPFR